MNVPDDLLMRYVKRRRSDFELCLRSLEKNDFSPLERVGHQLKGSGVTFGFEDLSVIGSELESASLARNKNSADEALGKLEKWLSLQLN